MNLGEIFDGAINTIRRHPALVFGVSAAVAVVNAALSFVAQLFTLDDLRNLADRTNSAMTPDEQLDAAMSTLGQTALNTSLPLVVTVLTTAFLAGFLTVVVGRAVLGRPIGFGEAMAEIKPRLLPLLGLAVLLTLMTAVGLFLCIVPGVWVWVLFGLSTPALVLERGKVGTSLTRSRLLVNGSWWRVFGILLLAGIISYIITSVIQIPFDVNGFLDAFSGRVTVPSVGTLLLQQVGALVATTLTAPFVASVTALLYIDQRMRKEGMDIQLARAAGTA
nr:hypothetical protein [Amycolatopsis anabasis]